MDSSEMEKWALLWILRHEILDRQAKQQALFQTPVFSAKTLAVGSASGQLGTNGYGGYGMEQRERLKQLKLPSRMPLSSFELLPCGYQPRHLRRLLPYALSLSICLV